MAEFAQKYRPRMPETEWEAIRPYLLTAIERVGIETDSVARDYVRAGAKFMRWCVDDLAMDPADPEIFTRPLVAQFISIACTHMTPSSRGTWQSYLTRIADTVAPADLRNIQMPTYTRSKPSQPYTVEEVEAMYHWAAGLTTELRRRTTLLILGLGLGAGMDGGEMRDLAVGGVHIDAEGVLVEVTTKRRVEHRRDRTVPVLAEWEDVVRENILWEHGPDAWAVRPGCKRDINTVNSFLANLPTKPTTPRGREIQVSAPRLRATWLVRHLEAGSPLKPLLAAAGLESAHGIERFLGFVQDQDIVEALRASVRERDREKGHRYREAHREQLRERDRLYWQAHRDELNARKRARYAAARDARS